jgi:hypothetical protein
MARESAHANPAGHLVRPSPLPANAPTEHEILAGMVGPRSAPANHVAGSRAVHGQATNVPPPPLPRPPPGDILSAIYRAPFNPEVLKRPEAHSVEAALASGHVTVELLLHHFVHGQESIL